jgi:hypothetical protein
MMNDFFSCLFWVRAFPARTDLSIPILAENSHESIRMLHLATTEPSLRRVHGERFLPHNFMKIGGWSSHQSSPTDTSLASCSVGAIKLVCCDRREGW